MTTDRKMAYIWGNKSGVGRNSLPPASVSSRGRRAAAVSVISGFHLIESVGNFWVTGGKREITTKPKRKWKK